MSMTDNAANVAICNQALGMLGAQTISVGSGTEQNHIYCTTFFDDARDEILGAHRWNFAKKRAYAIETTEPLFGFDKAYTKPSDCIKILQIEQVADAIFEVEGSLIVTNEGSTPSSWSSGTEYLAGEYLQSDDSGSTLTYLVDTAFTASTETTDLSSYCTSQGADLDVLEVEYIYQNTDVGNWPVYAKQCLITNLARMLCSPIKQDEEVAGNLQAMLYGGKGSLGYLDIARSHDAQEGGIQTFRTQTWLNARGR